jgi:hypothetical protein
MHRADAAELDDCRERYTLMSNEPELELAPGQPAVYQIRLKGQLGSEWTDWFEGLTIRLEEDGDTLLTGPVVDQAALHGLLKKVRDLGLPLESVNQVSFNQTHTEGTNKEMSVNTSSNTLEIKDRKNWLSTLWIFAMLNYIYADVFGLFFLPGAQKETASMAAGAVFGFAVLMETAIAMVLLSRVLKYGANRWANIVAGAIHTLAVVFSLFGGTPPAPYYMLFAAVEIACTLFIIWYAWTWHKTGSDPAHPADVE